MTVSVEKERYLDVACGDGEQIVFDRNRDEFHLLRGVAARIWETICDGGTFSFSDFGAAESVKVEEFTTALREMEKAELIRIENLDQESGAESSEGGKTKIDRRAWISLTGKAAAVATVLPLVMTLAAPKPGLATAKKKKFPHHGGDSSNGHHDVSPFCKDDSESNGDDYHRYSGGDEGGDDKCDVSTGDDHGDDHSNGDHHGGDHWWDKSNDDKTNDESNNHDRSNHQGNWWEKDEEDESNEDNSNQHHNYNNWWGR